MASFSATMSAIHKFWTLVRTASHLQLLLIARLVVLATASVLGAHPTVALQLDVGGARITRSWMTRSVARMRASLRPVRLALPLTLLTVGARMHFVHSVLHLVAIPPAGVVPAVQLSAAIPPTTPTLSHMARERSSFVGSQAGYGNWFPARRARQLLNSYYWTPLFPRSRRFDRIFNLDLNIVMAGGWTNVGACEGFVAALLAGRARRRVTVVSSSGWMVTVRRCLARLSASRGTTCSLPPAWSHNFSSPASTLDFHSLDAGIAGTLVTPGFTFVVLALQGFVASVIAGRTCSVAALFIAGVSSAIPPPFALDLTGVDFGALYLLRFSPAAAGFIHHLVALRTSAPVASLGASVSAAHKCFPAGIAASRRGFRAREIIAGFPAGAKSRLR